MIISGLFIFLLVGVVIVHMTRPRYEPRELSAARFFTHLPETKQKNNRLKPANPLKSLPLYLQFPLLAALFWAVLSANVLNPVVIKEAHVGLWILVDTSASMSTLVNNGTYLTRAQASVATALETSARLAQQSNSTLCARLSGFDLERRDIIPPTSDLAAIREGAQKLSFRPLGTDLGLLQKILSADPQPAENISAEDAACPITHLLIISDLPAPEWTSRQDFLRMIWLDIGTPVENSGITGINALTDPIVGKVNQVIIELGRYGQSEPIRTVQISDPSGVIIATVPVTWGGNQAGRASFVPTNAGLYHIQVQPADAYTFDDQAAINISTGDMLRVDWQLPDRSLMNVLPWQQTSQTPALRILPASQVSQYTDGTPTLFVGQGYQATQTSTETIAFFLEGHPLTRDLNFDVAELVGNAGQSPYPDFLPVLASTEHIWAAYRPEPLAAYVPGLPGGDANLGAFSTTLFFNAVRFLVQSAPQEPLYELTSSLQPELSGTRTALHPDEGNTYRTPLSVGQVEDLRPAVLQSRSEPTWPVWVALASLVLLAERLLFIFGGSRWR